VVKFKAGGSNETFRPFQREWSLWEYRRYSLATANYSDGSFHDSFSVTIGYVILSKSWRKYTINLKTRDLSCVIGAFGLFVDHHGNMGNADEIMTAINEEGEGHVIWHPMLTFFIDDIQLE